MFKQGKAHTAPARVIRSQSQKVHPRPVERDDFDQQYQDEQRIKLGDRGAVESMKQESTSRKLERKDQEQKDIKRDEEVKQEYIIRESFEDEVDMASYDSFPASDPPSTEMTT